MAGGARLSPSAVKPGTTGIVIDEPVDNGEREQDCALPKIAAIDTHAGAQRV